MRNFLISGLAAAFWFSASVAGAQVVWRSQADQEAFNRYAKAHPGADASDFLAQDRFCSDYRSLGLAYLSLKTARVSKNEALRQAEQEAGRRGIGLPASEAATVENLRY